MGHADFATRILRMGNRLFLKGNSTLKLRMKNLVPSWQVFKEVASIGLAPFIMQFASSAVAILLNNGL